MEERENTELIVMNYYEDGWPFDFTLQLHNVEMSIKSHREKIELADKYNLELKDSTSALPDLIADLRSLKDLLKGKFNIVVINEIKNKKESEEEE